MNLFVEIKQGEEDPWRQVRLSLPRPVVALATRLLEHCDRELVVGLLEMIAEFFGGAPRLVAFAETQSVAQKLAAAWSLSGRHVEARALARFLVFSLPHTALPCVFYIAFPCVCLHCFSLCAFTAWPCVFYIAFHCVFSLPYTAFPCVFSLPFIVFSLPCALPFRVSSHRAVVEELEKQVAGPEAVVAKVWLQLGNWLLLLRDYPRAFEAFATCDTAFALCFRCRCS